MKTNNTIKPGVAIILLFQALKEPRYLGLAVIFTILALFSYAFLQILPQGLNNFWFWFSLLTPFAWFLYLLYGILFGITLSFFIWQRKKKVCPHRKVVKGGFFGVISGFFGTTASICSGCVPWLGLIFPTTFIVPLLQNNFIIIIFSIVFLFLTLWFLGGLEKQYV